MGTDDQRKYDVAKRYAVTAWAVVGCAVVFVLVVKAMGLIWPAVELFLVGVILGFICSPITNSLWRHGVPRGLAALVALLVVVGVLLGLVAVLVPPVVQQTIELLHRVPYFVSQAQQALSRFWAQFGNSDNAAVQGIVNQLASSLGSSGNEMASKAIDSLSNGLVTNLIDSVSHLTNFLLGMVLAYWLAKDYPVMVREFAKISGPKHEDSFRLMLAVMSRAMGGYMRSIVWTSLICGVASFVAMAAIGHPYAGLAAVIIGLFHFVPVIGAWVSIILAGLLGLIASPMVALWTLVLTIVIVNVTDNVISPVIMQSSVRVHPALSLVGIMIGGALGGVLGMLLAVPLTAAIRSVFVFYFERRTGRQIVSSDGAIFRSTPYVGADGSVQPSFDALDDDEFFRDSLLVGDHVSAGSDPGTGRPLAQAVKNPAPAGGGAPHSDTMDQENSTNGQSGND
ncbi:MAG: AI-2E family transporter [Atopobiaceae bacterium]